MQLDCRDICIPNLFYGDYKLYEEKSLIYTFNILTLSDECLLLTPWLGTSFFYNTVHFLTRQCINECQYIFFSFVFPPRHPCACR